LLNFLGPHLSCDALLVADLLRAFREGIGAGPPPGGSGDAEDGAGGGVELGSSEAAAAAAPSTAAVSAQLLAMLREHVLPALSLCGSNACLAHEAWEASAPNASLAPCTPEHARRLCTPAAYA
jgi:hypothetical protein